MPDSWRSGLLRRVSRLQFPENPHVPTLDCRSPSLRQCRRLAGRAADEGSTTADSNYSVRTGVEACDRDAGIAGSRYGEARACRSYRHDLHRTSLDTQTRGELWPPIKPRARSGNRRCRRRSAGRNRHRHLFDDRRRWWRTAGGFGNRSFDRGWRGDWRSTRVGYRGIFQPRTVGRDARSHPRPATRGVPGWLYATGHFLVEPPLPSYDPCRPMLQ